jgi:hypothetical protein
MPVQCVRSALLPKRQCNNILKFTREQRRQLTPSNQMGKFYSNVPNALSVLSAVELYLLLTSRIAAEFSLKRESSTGIAVLNVVKISRHVLLVRTI